MASLMSKLETLAETIKSHMIERNLLVLKIEIIFALNWVNKFIAKI